MGTVLPGTWRLILTMACVARVVRVVAGVVMVMMMVVMLSRVVRHQLWWGRGSCGVPRHV